MRLTPRVPFAIALLVGVACSANRPRPVDFDDPLTGPVSPALNIPFENYALTATGLLRTHSESGTENGIERPVIRTLSGGYLSRDFVFEVDVTIPKDHGDIAYVGFGAGQTNPGLDNEPSRAILFRIHNLPRMSFYGIDLAIGDPQGGVGFRGAFRHFARIAEYTPGRAMRFQITHRGGKLTLSIPALPQARAEFETAQFRDLFTPTEAHLFLSNSSQGTTFTNASLRNP
jgi:hypothetical protein